MYAITADGHLCARSDGTTFTGRTKIEAIRAWLAGLPEEWLADAWESWERLGWRVERIKGGES